MWKYLLFIFLIGNSPVVFADINYDSLLTIAQNTTKQEDFIAIEAYLNKREHEYSTAIAKELIIYCSGKTKTLKFELIHGKFKFLESIINAVHGDIGVSMKMANEALIIFSKSHASEMAQCYNTKASMTAGLGDYKTALEYIQKAELINQ